MQHTYCRSKPSTLLYSFKDLHVGSEGHDQELNVNSLSHTHVPWGRPRAHLHTRDTRVTLSYGCVSRTTINCKLNPLSSPHKKSNFRCKQWKTLVCPQRGANWRPRNVPARAITVPARRLTFQTRKKTRYELFFINCSSTVSC